MPEDAIRGTPVGRIRILFLEDSRDDVERVRQRLSAAGVDCEIKRVASRPTFKRALEKEDFDLVLAAYALQRFDGLAALDMAREVAPNLPVIIISGVIGEDLAIETLKLGATDYIIKQRLGRLVPIVVRVLRERQQRDGILVKLREIVEGVAQCTTKLKKEAGIRLGRRVNQELARINDLLNRAQMIFNEQRLPNKR